MKVYDISMGIGPSMPVYKGRAAKRPVLKRDSDFETGSVYETRLEMNLHTGTHIDMPLHILQGGSTIETLALERVVTRCRVLDLQSVAQCITREDLAGKEIGEGDFILLKTINSYQDILEGEFIYLDKTGADYLRECQVRGVGIDSLGIERDQPGHETHRILLGAGTVIIEGLRLANIDEGEYFLIAVPVKVIGAEAAPVRAVLLKATALQACNPLGHTGGTC